MDGIQIFIGIATVVLTGCVLWILQKTKAETEKAFSEKISEQKTELALLKQQLEMMSKAQEKIGETTAKSIEQGQMTVNKSLQFSQEVIQKLTGQIGSLQQASVQMLSLGGEVRRLQDILQSPKLRGQLGEWSLENLLTTVLPAGSYSLQEKMKDGKIVDAMIELAEYRVPVDAKFPLNNFELMMKADDEQAKKRARREFIKDVKKHIDKIAASYIRPDEGTLDFAMMYVPAENVYYETVIKTLDEDADVQNYALEKKVVPVSPNLLYAYLMTVVMGLHGLQIEKQAAEIRRNIGKLNGSFADFTSQWDTLGRHVSNVYGKYQEAGKKLDRFGMELERVQSEANEE